VLAALMVLALTGCGTFYVDTALKDVPADKGKKVTHPQPVQLLFEFQTKGATNPRATEFLKEKVTGLVSNSGLFSQVVSSPASNGSVLNIVINNVPLTENAAEKGFVTGLTFGLAGSAVTDGYICTVEYLAGQNAQKISKTVRHAIHTTLGASAAPPNAVKSESMEDALNTMLRQIVSNGLNDVASDPSFK
jgi:hypothetical protein